MLLLLKIHICHVYVITLQISNEVKRREGDKRESKNRIDALLDHSYSEFRWACSAAGYSDIRSSTTPTPTPDLNWIVKLNQR